MTELGKAGKHLGVSHPRDIRKIDHEPAKPSVARDDGPKARKRYGFSYHCRYKGEREGVPKKWRKKTHWSWYDSEKKRDQAMIGLRKSFGTFSEFRGFVPIDRANSQPSEVQK